MRIRLRKVNINQDCQYALKWYQNKRVLIGSEGLEVDGYSLKTIERMYRHLNSVGHLYMIEVLENNQWEMIGDATLSRDMLPIVIGDDRYINKGIGSIVLNLLLKLARFNQIEQLLVSKVFAYNIASQSLYEKAGFNKQKEMIDDKGVKYYTYSLKLMDLNK